MRRRSNGWSKPSSTRLIVSLSSALTPELSVVCIVFNNHGYSTQRFILDGPFNDIAGWRYYDRIGELIGHTNGYCAATENEREMALHEALATTGCPSLINAQLQPSDSSPAMRRLAQHLRRKAEG